MDTVEYYEYDEIMTLDSFLSALEDHYDFRDMVGLGLSLIPKEKVDEALKNCAYLARETDQLGSHPPF